MTTGGYIILFSVAGSFGALATAGIILTLPERVTKRLVSLLISYAIGTLLAASLLGMIPQALHELPARTVMLVVLAGLIGFFCLESLVLWRHCHVQDCPVHGASGPLMLVGDAFHNFVDGLVIAGSFMVSVPLGISSSLAILAHEIPQEAGDFAVLIHGGYSRRKAILLNALSASTTVLGAGVAYAGMQASKAMVPYVLCVSSASFLYIALADLIPVRRMNKNLAGLSAELGLILAGILTMSLIRGHS